MENKKYFLTYRIWILNTDLIIPKEDDTANGDEVNI